MNWKNILFFLAWLSIGAFAQEARLTLDQAVDIAMNQNPEILLAEKRTMETRGQRLQMGALPDPEVVFSDEGLGFRKKSSAGLEKEVSLGIQQNLEFPGKRSLRNRIGRFGEAQAAVELERTRLLVSSAVKRIYYRVVLSQRIVETLEKNSALLDQLIENLLAKYQAGSALYVDVLRARAEKARLQNQMIEEKREGSLTRTELNLLLGRKGDHPIELMTGMAYSNVDEDLRKLNEKTIVLRTSMKITTIKRLQAETGLKLAKMNPLPNFSLGLFSPSLRTQAWGFSIGISAPLYGWKKQKGEVIEAQAVHDMALIRAQQTERRVLSHIESSVTRVRAAAEQVQIYEHQLLQEMEDELNISFTHYQYGRIEFFNLLDLYRTYTATRLDHLKSLYNYFVSLADLEVAGEESVESEAI
jgi:outer membrane protein, heavy metal efflux system